MVFHHPPLFYYTDAKQSSCRREAKLHQWNVVPRLSHRLLLPLSSTRKLVTSPPINPFHRNPLPFREPAGPNPSPDPVIRSVPFLTRVSSPSSSSPRNMSARVGWILGMREKKQRLPEIVKAGDPVLHEPAREVGPDEIGSDKIQKIIDDMVKVMRVAPGVGLAAPQIGVPLNVMINPKLIPKSNKTALFFEGCLSVDSYRAALERFLEVEVTGLDRYGQPIKVDASGWQARIFQHECDHLEGTLYVDKMVKRTFRVVENLDLPLPIGCPKSSVQDDFTF